MTKEDQDLMKAGIWCGAMFGLWILSTSLLLARLERKIDTVATKKVECSEVNK